MRAAIYARFSSAGQRDQSIEDQVRSCRKYAKDHDMEVVEVYADYAQSGRTDHRKEFQRMLAESGDGLFEIVLVWKLDRFGRNREDMILNRAKLKKNGVRIISVMENIPEDPAGVLLEGLLESLAEFYSLNLSENVKRGLKSNAEKGLINGPLPFGYKNEDGKIVPDGPRAEVVKLIFKLYIDGYNRAEIARILNEKGFRSKKGNKFHPQGIERLLKNRRYTGTYIYKKEEKPNFYEPLVSEEDFMLVQEMLATRGFKNKGNKDEYLLQGVLYCGLCGNTYTSETGTSRTGKVYHYYKCSLKKKNTKNCSNDVLKKDEFEEAVIGTVLSEILNESVIDILAERTAEKLNTQESDLLPELKKELEDTKRANRNLIRSIEENGPNEFITARIRENLGRIDELETSIWMEERKNPPVDMEAVRWALKEFKLSYLSEVADRRFLVNHFIDSVIYTSGIVTINFKLVYMDESGKIKGILRSSNYDRMVYHKGFVLNSIVYHEDGTFSYSFDYKNWLQAS